MFLKLIILLSTIIIQFIFLDQVESNYFRVDLVLIVIIYFSIFHGQMTGQLLGFFFGMIQDTIQFQFIGLNMLSLSTIGFLIGYLRDRINLDNTSIQFIIVFFTYLLREIIHYICYFLILDIASSSFQGIFSLVLGRIFSAILNGFISYIIFFILYKLMRNYKYQ